MTGKAFKAWAASLTDDCLIETPTDRYTTRDWCPLDPERIRATSQPPKQEQDPNALENIRD